ncbi:hypothetical protein M406DRAFT_72253 [Cryphonectria parasitica EP155]|uniref:Uncharacterized protein n=1 Tax=Cryphonectria parasitica (strain ATCC 38755 / EP155) TaxID=660469 RepID=A0A9P4XWV3_CRYP1|nr:uncharacterized protein M406DRAFT_72253 [Cryphonectria parasitica EP155]KAF3762235.1 hypothetical protein M406DRAFT_72253 [Cryphonectria parasitica EP155]
MLSSSHPPPRLVSISSHLFCFSPTHEWKKIRTLPSPWSGRISSVPGHEEGCVITPVPKILPHRAVIFGIKSYPYRRAGRARLLSPTTDFLWVTTSLLAEANISCSVFEDILPIRYAEAGSGSYEMRVGISYPDPMD